MRLTRPVFAWGAFAVFLTGSLSAQDQPPSPAQFEPPQRLKAGGEFIDTGKYVGHAGPFVMDLDDSGKPVLLVGNFMGHFQVYMNTGTRAEPAYEDQGLLKTDGATAKVPNW